MRTIEYTEQPGLGSSDEPKKITTTIHDYDRREVAKQWKAQLMGLGMMAVMHLYFNFTNPLVVQSILPIKSALEHNLAQIHVFGKDDKTGDLQRPWKETPGFMKGFGAEQAKAEKRSAERIEMKAGAKAGAKEE